VIVTEWRVVHAAQAPVVPLERAFEVVDDRTLVAHGDSIRVALVVAADGTTVRVSAYGVGARDRVAGWPTTMAQPPDAPPPGPAPTDTDTLVAIGRDVIAGILAGR
jgi:hypothetical protein